jgi:hypothetical protein
LEGLFNTLLTIGTEGVHECATNTGGPPDTTIDEDFKFGVGPRSSGLESSDNLHEVLNTRASSVELTTTVVRQYNSSKAIVIGHECVFGCSNTLENNGH